jgi:predicted anti-sigma-YlaC factor YlaD
MVGRICEHEPDMLAAAARGEDRAGAAAAHLASCASCREAVAAVAWMRQMADASGEPHPLPDPAVIWWKAQLLRRWESERRAVAPIERMHWIEVAAGVASFGVFLVWQWSGLVNLAAGLSPARLAALSSSSTASTSPLVLMLILGGTIALGGTIFASLHRKITHE